LLRGGSASIDFAGSLPQGTTIAAATVNFPNADGTPAPLAATLEGSTVMLSSAPRIALADSEEEAFYTLNLALDGAQRDERICGLRLAVLSSHLTPYSEASFTAAANNGVFQVEAPPAPPTSQPPAEVTEPTPPPAAVDTPPPLVIPTNVPLLGELTSPTPTPTQTLVPTQTPEATETPEPSPTPRPTSTPQPSPTPDVATPSPTPTATGAGS
jgi:hypothetical protein